MGLTGLFVLGVLVWAVVGSSVRRWRWPHERRRREGLPRAMASVESCERLTGAGHCDLIVAFEAQARRVRLRTAIKLPDEVFERIEASCTIPLRLDPIDVRRTLIDFEKLFGASAGDAERNDYVHGSTRWRVLESP
jgi:hypothetical protein